MTRGRLNQNTLTGYSGLAVAVIATAVQDAKDGVPDAREFLCSEWCIELVELASDSLGLGYGADELAVLVAALPAVEYSEPGGVGRA